MRTAVALIIAFGLALPSVAKASLVPPAEDGIWQLHAALPAAITSGDYRAIKPFLTSQSEVLTDNDRVIARGEQQVLAYLAKWYGSSNHVLQTYPGYASLMISVERQTERPWDRAYVMIATCHAGKITHITIINRSPL